MAEKFNISQIIYDTLQRLPHGMAVEEIFKAAVMRVCEVTNLYLHDGEIAEIFSEVLKPEVLGEIDKDITIVPKINVDMLAATLQTKLELARIRQAN